MKKPAKPTPAAKVPRNRLAPREVVDGDAPEHIRDAVWRLKRERIVATAVDLFYDQGYSNTTLEQVADHMHVTKPFIYSHFKSKSELLAEICARATRAAHEAISRAAALPGTATEKLDALVRDFMLAALNHQPHTVIYSREETHLEEEDRESINVLRREFDHRLGALLEEGRAIGDFVVDDVPLTALAIGGIVVWSPVWYRPGGRLGKDETAEKISTLVLAMVQAKNSKRRKPRV